MQDLINRHLVLFLCLHAVFVWLMATTVCAFAAGWFRLVKAYPNRPAEPVLKLRRQSGMMGAGVFMQGVLTLGVCQTGLRLGIWRLFGPWSRTFLVPWDEIRVVRTQTFFAPAVKLQFGTPVVGSLRISANTAARLGAAAGPIWPETAPPLPEAHRVTARRILIQWGVATCAAALFFILVPRLAGPNATSGPPIAVAILFPAIAIGMCFFFRYLWEKS